MPMTCRAVSWPPAVVAAAAAARRTAAQRVVLFMKAGWGRDPTGRMQPAVGSGGGGTGKPMRWLQHWGAAVMGRE
eukprot:scaffold23371_cov18-Tisochrysis_lutea.AAC.1